MVAEKRKQEYGKNPKKEKAHCVCVGKKRIEIEKEK